jgi:hypothetical protein
MACSTGALMHAKRLPPSAASFNVDNATVHHAAAGVAAFSWLTAPEASAFISG